MNFLRKAFRKAEQANPREHPPIKRHVRAKTVTKQAKHYIYRPTAREVVVGGEVLWRPVDKQAAMLLRKSPWWAKPL